MPKFKPNPDGMKPSGFKMKGWGGYQSSPVKKGLGDIKLIKDLKAVGKDISEKIKSVKSGEAGRKIKDDIKKLKKELGLKEKESKESESDISIDAPDTPDIDAKGTIVSPDDSITNPGDLVETNPWTSGSGNDPWEYKKVEGGNQTRKGPKGEIKNIPDPKSKAYQAIGEKIFDVEPVKPVTTEKIDVKEMNMDKLKSDEVGTLNNPHDYYPGAGGVDGQYYTSPRTGQTMRFNAAAGKSGQFNSTYIN